MSIDFKLKDFAYPLSIWKMHRFLEQSQWYSESELKSWENRRLQEIISHAYTHIPYYNNLFKERELRPEDISCAADLRKLPYLTKEIIRNNFEQLQVANLNRYKPKLIQTSGTSGTPLRFYHDKSANVLEFCYYWRYWSWAGYRLGDRFADFSIHHFLKSGSNALYHQKSFTNQLFLNPMMLSLKNISSFVAVLKKFPAKFIKTTPTVLHTFALLLEKSGCSEIQFRAAFTTGEKVQAYQRERVRRILGCEIHDSYAHMERTMAVCQCSEGSYHINRDYGLLQTEERAELSTGAETVAEVVGTSLHNFIMPLIRYKTEDLISLDKKQESCSCGRHFPLIKEVFGRSQDILITPDRRFIANVFVMFNLLSGIEWYRVVQESLTEFKVLLVARNEMQKEKINREVRRKLLEILGEGVSIEIHFLSLDEVPATQKSRHVESKLRIEEFL